MEARHACMLCGRGPSFPRIYERSGYVLVRCPDCGLVFQDPQPRPEALQSAYYFDEAFAHRLENDLRPIAEARAREKLPLLVEAGATPGGTALDVGCSSGAWMKVAREAGWQPMGVEIGEPAAAVARRSGFDVITGTLDTARDLPEAGFDLVTFWDVLEHLHEPVEALSRAASLVKPGGMVAMTFPNVRGWYPRVTYRLFARRTGVWEYPELPVHLYDFGPETAERLVRSAGLEVQRLRTTPIPFDFYRHTTLRDQLGGRGARGLAARGAFEALRWLVYPPARVFDRGNALFVLARRPAGDASDAPAS